MTALRRPDPPERVCACGAEVTSPVQSAKRCAPCEAEAQQRWFDWLNTNPETRIPESVPNQDTDEGVMLKRLEGEK